VRSLQDPVSNLGESAVLPNQVAHGFRHSVSRLALVAGVSLAIAACAKQDGFNAALCARGPTEAPGTACEPPKTPVRLTLPRPELLRPVEIDPTTTGSSESNANRPAEIAQTTREGGAQGPTPTPAAAETPAPAPAAQITPAEAPAAQSPPAAESAPKEAAPPPKSAPATPDARVNATRPGNSLRERLRQKMEDEQSPDQKAGKKDDGDVPAKSVGTEGGPSLPSQLERGAGPTGPSMTLADAVRRAIGDHPLIGLAGARITEAEASIGVSRSQLYPQVEGRVAGGHGVSGSYQTSTNLGYFSNDNAYGSARGEASLSGRQLLFDFGAAKADIERTSALHRSETLKLHEQTEDVTNKVQEVYLRLLEQRELLSAATENVAALEKIAKLVEDNEKNGNGTVADIKRVRSRLVDGQTAQADAKSELQTGSDRFRRLVRVPPGPLKPAPALSNLIPRSPDLAIAAIGKGNPRIRALEETLKAARHEAEAQKANAKPKVSFESDVSLKEYRTRADKTEIDAKGLVVLKYKFFDGGQQSKQLEQVNARVLQTEMRLRNEMDEIEAEIRKHYRILQSARGKAASLRENVETALKARQLYDEQFRGGKRTLLELLDIQTAYYTARRTHINNRFEEQRSVNGILLAMGRLTEAMVSGRVRVAERR
jgi:adhesin transport system outer membrane protein